MITKTLLKGMIKKIICLEVRESQSWYENEGKSVNKEYTQSLVWLMALISWGMCNLRLLMGKVLGFQMPRDLMIG